jgi:ATP adenylyltransferase
MESLHAPWRIEYILAAKSKLDDSIFTTLGQSLEDEANFVIARDRTCFAVLNRYPYNGGHLMTVPYKQVADLNGLTDEELAGIVEHLHIHVVPRWGGDTNFMPVIGGTGVLPEALQNVAAKLRAELAK